MTSEGSRPVEVETLVPDGDGNLHIHLSLSVTRPYDLAEGDEVVVFTTEKGILLAPSDIISPQKPSSGRCVHTDNQQEAPR